MTKKKAKRPAKKKAAPKVGRSLDEFKEKHDPHTQITQLKAELRKASAESADSRALKEAVGTVGMDLDGRNPPRWTLKREDPSSPGVPTLFLSDLHWGEVVHSSQINGVNSFNMSIARTRLQYAVETAIKLLHILDPKMAFPGIVVPLGGDMISGNIHEELQATNELNTMPTVLDLLDHLIAAINLLADTFGNVFLPCVSGNHGRDTRKPWKKDRHHTSFDWLLYQLLAKWFHDDERVVFYVPDGPDAYYRIFNHRYLLTHGDQFRGGDSIIGPIGPLTRGTQKKQARNQAVNQEFDTLLAGHWHQYIHLHYLIVNGSLKGYDEFAYSNNYRIEPAVQALWITHPRYGITYRMPVYCEQGRKQAKSPWVSVKRGI